MAKKLRLPFKTSLKALVSSVFIFIIFFLIGLVASSEFCPPSSSSASSIQTILDNGGYYINISSNDTININLHATAAGSSALAEDAIRVTTNTAGYRIYVSSRNTTASSRNLYLDGETGSTYFVEATSGTVESPSELDMNSWGFAITNDEDSFIGVPLKGNEALIASATNLTAGIETTKSHTIYYGAKANLSLPAGNYTGEVVYSLVAEAAATEHSASVSPSKVIAEGGVVAQRLLISTSLMATMNDSNWNIRLVYTPDGVTPGTVPEASFSFECGDLASSFANNTLSLSCNVGGIFQGEYTVVASSDKYGDYISTNTVEVENPGFFGISTMQEMTPEICSAIPTPTANATTSSRDLSEIISGLNTDGNSTIVPEVVLTDTRDSRDYLVRKLADGNCWMAQNLELNLSTEETLTAASSDVTDDWTPENNTQNVATGSWTMNGENVARSYSPALANTYTYMAGGTSSATSGEPYERIGNFYNFYAATAGTGTTTLASGDATASICPKGWTLPIGGDVSSNKSLKQLLTNTYGLGLSASVAKLISAPLNYTCAGIFHLSAMRYVGRSSYYITKTLYSETTPYSLAYDRTEAYLRPGTNTGTTKGYGFNIRCVAR